MESISLNSFVLLEHLAMPNYLSIPLGAKSNKMLPKKRSALNIHFEMTMHDDFRFFF